MYTYMHTYNDPLHSVLMPPPPSFDMMSPIPANVIIPVLAIYIYVYICTYVYIYKLEITGGPEDLREGGGGGGGGVGGGGLQGP